MKHLLPTSPEMSGILGSLCIRHDLVNHSVAIYFQDWEQWDVDTAQVEISKQLIHFIGPDGEVVGVKAFGGVK